MNKKTNNTYLISVPDTHNLVKIIIDKQNKYQEVKNKIYIMRSLGIFTPYTTLCPAQYCVRSKDP